MTALRYGDDGSSDEQTQTVVCTRSEDLPCGSARTRSRCRFMRSLTKTTRDAIGRSSTRCDAHRRP